MQVRRRSANCAAESWNVRWSEDSVSSQVGTCMGAVALRCLNSGYFKRRTAQG